jgi:hypothetical protein
MKRTRPLRTKKLLVATLGVGALTFAAIGAFPGCNLLPPPPCDKDPNQFHCRDLGAPEDAATDLGTPDLGTPDLNAPDLNAPDLAKAARDLSGVD